MTQNTEKYELYIDDDGNLFTGEYKNVVDSRNLNVESVNKKSYYILTEMGSVVNGRPNGLWIEEIKTFDNDNNFKNIERTETEYENIGNRYYVKSSKSYFNGNLVSESSYYPMYDANNRLQIYSDVIKYYCLDCRNHTNTINYFYSEDGMKYDEVTVFENDNYISLEEMTFESEKNPIKYGNLDFYETSQHMKIITKDDQKMLECSVYYENNNQKLTIMDSLELYYDNGRKMIIGDCCPDDKTSFMVTMFERDGETVKKKGILAMKDIVNLHFQSRYLMMDKSFLQSSIESIKKLLD